MAEEAEPDTASWVEVEVTALFTGVTTAVFLLIFEVARRNPALADVFDRRRATNANRTPPPLIRGRILEWLFLSTDPEYWEYSQRQHDKAVIQERRRQRECLQFVSTDAFEDEPDEDEHPSAKRKLRDYQQQVDVEAGIRDTSTSNQGASSGARTSSITTYPFSLISSSVPHVRKKQRTAQVTMPNKALTPDVCVIRGRRLPISVAQYAMSGDLTEEQLDFYAEKLLEKERLEEHQFYEKQQEQPIKSPNRIKYLGVRQRYNFPLSGIWNRLCCKKKSGSNEAIQDGISPKSTRTMLSTSSGGDVLGASAMTSPFSSTILSRISSGRSILHRESITGGQLYINRHLKSAMSTIQRPLGIADLKLLQCIGLDGYVMIRFLRFGFDCTFYPFCLACLTLIPTYYTNDYEGNQTEGYFKLTINALEPDSDRLWIAWGFAILFYCYILRKIWVEWETFLALRFDFLANGDAGQQQEVSDNGGGPVSEKDHVLYLEQYRNTCLIEYVPESHRRDKELFEFFDAIFPNQVKRAEILLNANCLSKLIKERQKYIERYENLYAKQFQAKQVYRRKKWELEEREKGHGRNKGCLHDLCCCSSAPKKPQEPKIPLKRHSCTCCGKRKMVRAYPFYLSEIKRLNVEIEEEHRRILVERHKSEDKEESQNFFSIGLENGLKFVRGAGTDLTCSTGFVEFKNITAKQSAIQCNITGTNNFMVTTPAPDPRDIIWENATVDMAFTKVKHLQCDLLLLTAALFWSVVVTFITSISNLDRLDDFLPAWLIPEEDTFWYGLIQGYLPVLVLEFFMLFVPIILRFVGMKYILFKSHSEVDKFVFFWHFVFRLANLLVIIISGSLYDTLSEFQGSPGAVINTIAANIAQSSQFFLNNMIVAAGSENTWELAQVSKMIQYFVVNTIVTVEAKSKRALEKLEQAESFEWGEVMPPCIFAFLVGAVYCTIVPVVIGACAIFFYIATKVYTHQAQFVYAQPYEGGGKLMYLLNRTVFVILYISIIIFSTVLGLRQAPLQGPSFFFLMMGITIWVDMRIGKTFVQPSLTLALTNARIIDDENTKREDRARRYKEYKAAKLEKRRKEKEEQEKRRQEMQNKKLQELEAFETKSKQSKNKLSSRDKRIKFKEEEPESQPQGSKKAVDGRGDVESGVPLGSGSSKSFSNQEDQNDFFLYRQPCLNKSLWETKPRPYR